MLCCSEESRVGEGCCVVVRRAEWVKGGWMVVTVMNSLLSQVST